MSSMSLPCRWRLTIAVLCLCIAALVQAQNAPDDASDPPSRVARLSYLAGDLGMLPAGATDWGEADVNRPLTTGDRLSSSDHARAELELGDGTVRIAEHTDIGFLDLNDQLAQIELTQGTLNLAVRQLQQGQSYEIDTPTVALVVNRPGIYRVDIGDNGNGTRVTVFDGGGVVYGENHAQRDVIAGRSYEFNDSALHSVVLNEIGSSDAFDAWCSDRDQRYVQTVSRRYVSEEVVGYQDLDEYGHWSDDPQYGAVWYPANVDVAWAPYRAGHWVYVGPWGWTWVDDLPWGFAPYHYGRWAYIGHAWGWIPGPIVVRPMYAPALVAFVGGGRWGLSVGGGAPVGWFPLGPGEIYNPWYRASRNYYSNVNVTNIHVYNGDHATVINNINNQYNAYRNGQSLPNQVYVNRNAPHAFTAVSAQNFANASRVQNHMLQVDPHQLAASPVLARGVPMSPNRASFAPSRGLPTSASPAAGFNRQVVSHNAPAASFGRLATGTTPATPRPAIAQNPQRPFSLPAQSAVTHGTLPVPANLQPAHRPVPEERPGALPSAGFAHAYPTEEGTARGGLPNVPRIERASVNRADNEPPRWPQENRPVYQTPYNEAAAAQRFQQQRAQAPAHEQHPAPQHAHPEPHRVETQH